MRGVPVGRQSSRPQTTSFDVLKMMDELRLIYSQITEGIKKVDYALKVFESVKEGKPGMPGTPGVPGIKGKDGKNVTQQEVEIAVAKILRQPRDGATPEVSAIIEGLLSNGSFLKLVKRQLKITRGEPKKEEKFEIEAIVTMVLSELQNKKITVADVEGLDLLFTEMRSRIALSGSMPYKPSPGNARGGGDTVVAGAGVTITNTNNGNKEISVGGGGVSIETPVGTVNSVNDTFTVTAEPLYVTADGIQYFDGAGYTYAALTITMDVPPSQYIRAAIST